MQKNLFNGKIKLVLVMVVCLFFISLAFSGTAPKPTKTYYLSVSVDHHGTGYYYQYCANLLREVNLPDGATITEFRIFGYDNNPTEHIDLDAVLYSRGLYEPEPTMLTEVLLTPGDTGLIESAYKSGSWKINNQDNQYFIKVIIDISDVECGNENLRYYGARIAYTMG